MPIPVSRLAGSDTIEDIFRLNKRSTDVEPDIDPAPPASRRATEKLDNVPLATPHRHSTHLHFRKPQIASMDSTEGLSTPLLMPSSASSSSAPPSTPNSTLDTPPAPAPGDRLLSDALNGQKPRRALGPLPVNRSPPTTGFADLEVDNERYLRAALGLTYPEGWDSGFGYWPEVYKDGAYAEDRGAVDAWYTGENELHGWAFSGPGESREFDKVA